MNININLSQIKDKINGNVIITIILILLAFLLGYTCWYTFEEGEELQSTIYTSVEQYENNRLLLKNLKNLQANSDYYAAQKEKYDEVIADADTYNTVDYYVELTELCEKYELTIKEITIGEMVPMGNVKSATSTLAVEGDEINVKQMAEFIVSQKQIARIDTMAMTEQADGSVLASLVIVNFTK
jgi:hypothetical protein